MKAGKDYVGISTAFILTDKLGRILLSKRSTKCRDEHGTWDSGAGQLEVGLTLEENAAKEVLEEYGCKGRIVNRFEPFELFRKADDGSMNHWIHFGFVILVDAAEVVNNEPDKLEAMGWFYTWSLPAPLHPGTEKALSIWKDKNYCWCV